MSRFELILLCLCLGACSAQVPGIDPLTMAGLNAGGYQLVATDRQFQDHVVGHRLSADGYRARIEPGGTLSGLYDGNDFNGVWVFTEDGKYCQSLTQVLSGPASGCYWVAVRGEQIRLIPAPAG